MCGICGFVNLNNQKANENILVNMTNAIAHRGPDGEGQYVFNNVALGHRRLSILDLTDNASQPMTSVDGNYTLVYNGEIYNFKDVRQELVDLGHRFRSTGDTEVLLFAFAQWGVDCVHKFNGMFAFAIYDKINNKVTCARDRYGIKPFYYAVLNNIFLFGSEQKAIFAHPSFKHNMDFEGVVEYFTFQNIITDKTFEKDIKVLQPGQFFEIDLNLSICTIKTVRYWDFHFKETEIFNTEQEYAQELDRLLIQAVERQLVSDTEIGCFLSGGMDSGSITCLASRTIPHIKTFTCGYDMSTANNLEVHYDERRKSEIMAHAFDTEHYEMILQPSDIERCISKVAWHNEEPRVGQTYTNYNISRLVSKFVKVAFSGTGGDELFGGYPWRYYRAMNAKSFDEFIDMYYIFWQRLIPSRVIQNAFSPIASAAKNVNPKEIFKSVFATHENPLKKPEDYINHCLYFEAKTFLPGMLMIEDKLTMAHGLESRVPMLDNDLVDFGMKMPIKYKLSDLEEQIKASKNDLNIKSENLYLRTNLGKYLLRKTMEKYIPKEIDRADKQGFSAPDATWFKQEAREFVDRVIYNDKSRVFEVLDKKTIRELVDEHMNDKVNRRLLIWSLLNFEEILRKWY